MKTNNVVYETIVAYTTFYFAIKNFDITGSLGKSSL